MTSTVKVTAHCGADKEVIITRSNPDHEVIIQDGETYEQAVYDDRVITVREELKAKAPAETKES